METDVITAAEAEAVKAGEAIAEVPQAAKPARTPAELDKAFAEAADAMQRADWALAQLHVEYQQMVLSASPVAEGMRIAHDQAVSALWREHFARLSELRANYRQALRDLGLRPARLTEAGK